MGGLSSFRGWSTVSFYFQILIVSHSTLQDSLGKHTLPEVDILRNALFSQKWWGHSPKLTTPLESSPWWAGVLGASLANTCVQGLQRQHQARRLPFLKCFPPARHQEVVEFIPVIFIVRETSKVMSISLMVRLKLWRNCFNFKYFN